MDSSNESNKNFFAYVFNFDDESKSDILNIIQYALLAIIPIVILSKITDKCIPKSDDEKGSLEISAEIVFQVIFTFMALLIIHRIITFFPTFSGQNYSEFNIIYLILPVMMLKMTLKTEINEKINILVARIMELWDGSSDKKKKNSKNNVKVSQPISGQITGQQMTNTQSNYTDGTAISSLPTNDMQQQSQQLPNYDAMYRKDNTPLVDAATPEGFSNEPMAANSVLGGSSFGAAW